MKKLIVLTLMAFLACPAYADTYVQGYVRKDGTYVPPHYRTDPNSTDADNYSTRPNINPYNGRRGTKPCRRNCGAYQTSTAEATEVEYKRESADDTGFILYGSACLSMTGLVVTVATVLGTWLWVSSMTAE